MPTSPTARTRPVSAHVRGERAFEREFARCQSVSDRTARRVHAPRRRTWTGHLTEAVMVVRSRSAPRDLYLFGRTTSGVRKEGDREETRLARADLPIAAA